MWTLQNILNNYLVSLLRIPVCCSLYRVMLEERTILWEVTVSLCEERLYEHLSNLDGWLPKGICWNVYVQKHCEWQ